MVRSASIGFISKERKRNDFGGADHLRWELLEVSLCPVGANPEAVRTLKGLGLLDAAFRSPRASDVDLGVTRAHVERVVRGMRAAIRADVAERLKWAAMPSDAQVITLDDEDVLASLDPRDVAAAFQTAMTSVAHDAVTGLRRELRLACGAVD
jgi:hypothetical protein